MLAVSLLGNVLPASLQDFADTSDASVILLPSHTQVQLLDGAIFEDATLVEGAVLARTDGVTRLRTGRVDITALLGAFHLTRYGDALTVTALTAPVLVAYEDAKVLIPAGWTWRTDSIRSLTPLKDDIDAWREQRTVHRTPERFLRSQLSSLSILAPVTDDLLVSKVLPQGDEPSSLLFPSAREREWQTWSRQVIGALTDATVRNDTIRARTITESPTYASAFRSPLALEVIPVLLGQLEPESPLIGSLLSLLGEQADVSLLAAVHAHLRTVAWTLPMQDIGEDPLLLMYALPQSDVLTNGMSDFTMQRWMQSVSDMLRTAQDPLVVLESLIPETAPLVEKHFEADYPARANRLSMMLQQIAQPYRALLSAQTKSALKKLTLLDRVELSTQDEQEQSEDHMIEKEVVAIEEGFSPAEVESKAYEDFRNSGALFTVQTSIESVSPVHAEIHALIFGGVTQDVVTSFTYNVLTKDVEQLTVNDKNYPYAIALPKFLEWVRSL